MKPLIAPAATLYGDEIKTAVATATTGAELIAAMEAFDAQSANVNPRLLQSLENVLLTHTLTAADQQIIQDAIASIQEA